MTAVVRAVAMGRAAVAMGAAAATRAATRTVEMPCPDSLVVVANSPLVEAPEAAVWQVRCQ